MPLVMNWGESTSSCLRFETRPSISRSTTTATPSPNRSAGGPFGRARRKGTARVGAAPQAGGAFVRGSADMPRIIHRDTFQRGIRVKSGDSRISLPATASSLPERGIEPAGRRILAMGRIPASSEGADGTREDCPR